MDRNRWPAVVLATCLALMPLAAACSSDDDGGGGDAASPPAATDEPTEAPADGATVTLANLAFSPDEIEVTSGDSITATNPEASVPHTFTVTDTDIDVEVGAGAEESIAIDLDPGRYDVVCRFHEGSGMTATLTVA